MQQTAYKGILNLASGLKYVGGICRFWFIPINDVDSIPAIDPTTQYLLAEPVLKATKYWHGPVPIPDRQLGYTETQNLGTGGLFYKTKIAGNHPGDNAVSRINLDNLAYGRYLVVAKQRAGGMFLLFGSLESPITFEQDFTAGQQGADDTTHTKIAFTGESIHKAVVLPSFSGSDSDLDGCHCTPAATGNQAEVISFTGVGSVNFTWTPTRLANFGVFPEVELYIQGPDGLYYKSAIQPYIDAPPPGFTTMYFDFGVGASVTGFILIK